MLLRVGIIVVVVLMIAPAALGETVTIDLPGSIKAGSKFTVTVIADQASNLAGFDIFLKYNPTLLRYEGYSLGSDVQSFSINYAVTPREDTVELAALTSSPQSKSVSGTNIELLRVTFTALAGGETPLGFGEKSKLIQYNGAQIVDYANVDFLPVKVSIEGDKLPPETAVTGEKTVTTAPPVTTTPSTTQPSLSVTKTVEKTTQGTETQTQPGIPGFELVLAVTGVVTAAILGRKLQRLQ
jgi:hypothetical protein